MAIDEKQAGPAPIPLNVNRVIIELQCACGHADRWQFISWQYAEKAVKHASLYGVGPCEACLAHQDKEGQSG